jgi:hypothetical protein
MAFAIVGVLCIVLQIDTACSGPDQKADATPADAATSSLPSPDLAAIKVTIALARKGEVAQASAVKESIGDLVARKVAEWVILRSDSSEVDFRRYVAFISDNPNWPNIGLLRRRAEAALWKERLNPQTVRAYFDKKQPLTAQGKFALARALLLEGDRAGSRLSLHVAEPGGSIGNLSQCRVRPLTYGELRPHDGAPRRRRHSATDAQPAMTGVRTIGALSRPLIDR